MQPPYNYYPYTQPPPPPPRPPPTSYPYPPLTPNYYAPSQPYTYPPQQYYTYSAPPSVQYAQQYHAPPQPYYQPHPPPPAQAHHPSHAVPHSHYTPRTTNPISNTKHFCEPCDKEFTSFGAYNTHLKTHEKCPDPNCSFTASKRVVSTHYDLTHGIYGGHGYKMIDVEGQKFKVLMGTDPSEVEQWRAERRKRFPTAATIAQKERAHEKYLEQGGIDKRSNNNRKRKADKISDTDTHLNPLSQLAEYGSENEAADQCEMPETSISSPRKKKVCSYFLKGRCRHGKRCHFLHERPEQPTSTSPTETKDRPEKREKKGGLHLPKPLVGGKEGSLYRKLIEDLVHDDENLILQCFRFLVQENFFQKEDNTPL